MNNNIALLVHGTWGRGLFGRSRDAEWCTDDSLFRQYISEAFENDVHFEIFRWSGDNRSKARLTASIDLSHKIIELAEKHPKARIHIFCHSHGGNLGMWAIRDKEKSSRVHSIVCMSTPFLLFSRRIISKTSLVSIGATLSLLIGTQAFKIWDILRLNIENPLIDFLAHAVLGLLVVAPAILFPMLRNMISVRVNDALNEMALPKEKTCSVLLIRTSSDEASISLATAQFVSDLSAILQRPLLAILPTINLGKIQAFRFWKYAIASIIFSYLLLYLGHSIDSALVLKLFDYSIYVFLFLTLSPLVFFSIKITIATLILIPVIFLELVRSLMLIPFGSGPIWVTLGMNVSVESTPCGKWVINQLESNKGMNHLTHTNPKVLNEIREWLKIV
jgi:hypothetical protein